MPPRKRRRARFAWTVAALAVLPPAALAQEHRSDRNLGAVEREIESERRRAGSLEAKAGRVAAEAAEISRALVALARESRALERREDSLGRRIAELTRAREDKETQLRSERARLTRLLAALQRIARNPTEALLAYASSPADTLRSAMLLKSVIPRLEARAADLRRELASLARLGEDAAGRKAALAAAKAELARKRDETTRLLERKRVLVRTTEADRKRAAERAQRLTTRAKDLRGLIRGIERERRSRPALRRADPQATAPQVTAGLAPPAGGFGKVPPITGARGRLTVPVVGRLVDRFGTKGALGTHSQGLRFIAQPGAQVVAPHDGHVVFAGPFRGYGRLLIIDHGEGYHTLLAGLGRIDVAVHERLLAGEPIGIMARTGRESPRLYLELRRKGRPVDPLPWLAAKPTDKDSG